MKNIYALFTIACIVMSNSTLSKADETSLLFAQKSLTPAAALKVAQATMDACRKAGFQAAVAVVDRGGNMQVMLRDRFAGPHTPEVSRLKAYTALSFRTNTVELAESTKAGKDASGVRHIDGVLVLGGGVIIRAGGALVGAIGVSGAPGGQADENCAIKGIGTIQADLDF